MEHYLYLKSDQSNILFEAKFRIQLNCPLYLEGRWKVALVEFHATEKGKSNSKADGGLYIYTDMCRESIVQGEERPLLRRLEKTGKGRWDYILDSPFYIDVRMKDLRTFEIYIQPESDTDTTHLSKPVYLTLHLKRYWNN